MEGCSSNFNLYHFNDNNFKTKIKFFMDVITEITIASEN